MTEFLVSASESVLTFYVANLRQGFTTSMLSLTAILFTVQNFLLTGLYRDVYGKPRYRDYARRMEPDRHPLHRLEALASQMRVCTTGCLIAALTQLTLGFVPSGMASLVCIITVFVALLVFVRLYRTQIKVVRSWMEFLKWDADFEDRETNLKKVG